MRWMPNTAQLKDLPNSFFIGSIGGWLKRPARSCLGTSSPARRGVPKGRLKIAQHVVLGVRSQQEQSRRTTENYPGRLSRVYLQRTPSPTAITRTNFVPFETNPGSCNQWM